MKKVKTLVKRKALDSILNKRNMTYQDLSNDIYVDKTYISQLATGKKYVSERMRTLILERLDVEYNDIFEQIEINYVHKKHGVPELTISKDEIDELLKSGNKEFVFGGQVMNLKVVS